MLANSYSNLEQLKSLVADSNYPIDVDLLSKFTGNNFDFALEIIQDFIISVTGYLEEAKAALAINELVVLAEAAHKIKGASAQTAIKKIPDLASKLEYQAQAKKLNHAAELIAEIDLIVTDIRYLRIPCHK